MANSNLKSLSEIFNDKIFKIPDYQRGYSWENHEVEDFWRDLENLGKDKYHYTGMLTVDKDIDYYNIIDGQQRLTTIVILLKNILDKFDDEDWINLDYKKKVAVDKYLYKTTRDSENPNIIFGYKENNPSYEFYKNEILEIHNQSTDYENTMYTRNLENTNKLFNIKLKDFTKENLEILFCKITQQLKFNLYEIEKSDGLDEYVIFETMNNRGKQLSTLEILKNRLIYLTTLLDNDDNDKKILRDNINLSWKTMYEFIGKEPNKKIIDDKFLKEHWLMYWGSQDQSKASPERVFLLDNYFTVQKVLINKNDKNRYQELLENNDKLENILSKLRKIEHKNIKPSILEKYIKDIYKYSKYLNTISISDEEIFETDFLFGCMTNDLIGYTKLLQEDKESYSEFQDNLKIRIEDIKERIGFSYIHYEAINNYISSLKNSIISYYNILNPYKTNYNNTIKQWLEKINIIGTSSTMPLLMSIFNNKNISTEDTLFGLKWIENFLFVKTYFNHTTDGKEKELYDIAYKFTKYNIVEILKNGIHTNLIKDKKSRIFTAKKFIYSIEKLFEKKEGFYSWKGLTYLLYEYELSLEELSKSSKKVSWNDVKNKEKSIEHIYPQTPQGTWHDKFRNTTEEQKIKYLHSLGNLLLLSPSKNSSLGNGNFEKKKEKYSNGSYSEIEVSKNETWTKEEIERRGLKILNFMRERWLLDISKQDLHKLK